ncbi:MAG: ribonuclease P protein component [Pseudonocardiaceae bacterium]
MLPAAARLTRRDDFATAVKRGRRAACGSVVVHLAWSSDADVSPRVGFVVGRTVGGAVVRHRVQRRLRHLMRSRLGTLPGGALVVVRALPSSAGASSATLGADLAGALRRLTVPAPVVPAPAGSSPASGVRR